MSAIRGDFLPPPHPDDQGLAHAIDTAKVGVTGVTGAWALCRIEDLKSYDFVLGKEQIENLGGYSRDKKDV
jgi:hypothetical protein